jgi:glutamine synthetase
MAKTLIAPAALSAQGDLADTIASTEAISGGETAAARDLLKEICAQTDALLKSADRLAKLVEEGNPEKTLAEMQNLREAGDELEGLVPDEIWPLATYAEMMFIM